MRTSLFAFAIVSGLVAASPVLAAEEASDHSFSGNMTLASEYIYRGIAQTNRNPALQGGYDYSHSSGAYAGVWASNVSWLSDGGGGNVSNSLEADVYGGYKFSLGPVNFDAGGLYYYYPGTYPAGYTKPDTGEVYLSVGFQTTSLKYSYAVTDLFGARSPASESTRGSGYLDLTTTYEFLPGFSGVLHVGHQYVKNYADASYSDWKVGLTKDAFDMTFGLAYIGTNAKGGSGGFYRNAFGKDLGADRVVLTISKTF